MCDFIEYIKEYMLQLTRHLSGLISRHISILLLDCLRIIAGMKAV